MISRSTPRVLPTRFDPSTSTFPVRLIAAVLLALVTGAWTQQGGQTAGVLAEQVFASPSHGPVTVAVYTPPGYYTPGNTDAYPVLYWLHGSGGDAGDLAETLAGLPTAGDTGAEKLDAAILGDLVPPMIVVAPTSPDGTWDAPLAPFVTDELVAWVDFNFRTVADRGGRSLEGFSLGSAAVSRFFAPQPERFASASMLGGGFEPWHWSDAQEQVLVHQPALVLTVGDQDGFLADAQSLHAELDTLGIGHTYDVVPGVGHSSRDLYTARGLDLLQLHAQAWADAGVVDAGGDQSVDMATPAVLALAGQVDPAGLRASYDVEWQQVAGPTGMASFADPSAAATDVTLSAPGTYALRLTADDGVDVFHDVVTVSMADLGAGLVAHWSFDDATADDVAGSHDGVVQGPVYDPAGRHGGALAFDGVDDVVTVPDFAYGPEASFALWFRAVDLSGTSFQYLLSHNGFDLPHSVNVYLPEVSSAGTGRDQLRTVVRDDDDPAGRYLDVDGPWDDGQWHQVTVTLDAGGTTIYVDGEAALADPQGGDAWDPPSDLVLGGRSVSPVQRYFEGWLDDVRVYGRALTDAEAAVLGVAPVLAQAPQVDAGPDLSILDVEDAVLAGAVVDDGLPAAASVAWSQVSGPGVAAFSHPASPSTSATFSAPGTYVLRLTADDGAASDTDEVTVTVVDATVGLVAHWRLDETAGTSAADAASGFDGTLRGDADLPAWSTGAVDGALAFDAADLQAVEVGQPAALDLDPAADDFTLLAWIRVAPGTEGTVIGKAHAVLGQRQYQLYLYDNDGDGRSHLYANVGGRANLQGRATGTVVDDDQWHQVALVHDAAVGRQQLWVDGAPVGSPEAAGTATNGVDVMLGARRGDAANTGHGWALTGLLDDVRVYDRQVSAAEMSALYAAGAP